MEWERVSEWSVARAPWHAVLLCPRTNADVSVRSGSVRFHPNKVFYVFRPKHQHYTPEKWLIVPLLRPSLCILINSQQNEATTAAAVAVATETQPLRAA